MTCDQNVRAFSTMFSSKPEAVIREILRLSVELEDYVVWAFPGLSPHTVKSSMAITGLKILPWIPSLVAEVITDRLLVHSLTRGRLYRQSSVPSDDTRTNSKVLRDSHPAAPVRSCKEPWDPQLSIIITHLRF